MVPQAEANSTRESSVRRSRRNVLRSIEPALHQTVNAASTPIGECAVIQLRMADDSGIRLKNFKRLWDAHGWSPALLRQKCRNRTSYWSDLRAGKKSFGETIARKIEDGMGLIRLSLDDPDGARFEPLSAELRARLAVLNPIEAWKVENMIRGSLGMEGIRQPEDRGRPASDSPDKRTAA